MDRILDNLHRIVENTTSGAHEIMLIVHRCFQYLADILADEPGVGGKWTLDQLRACEKALQSIMAVMPPMCREKITQGQAAGLTNLHGVRMALCYCYLARLRHDLPFQHNYRTYLPQTDLPDDYYLSPSLAAKKVSAFTLSEFKEALQYVCCAWNTSDTSKALYKFLRVLEIRFAEFVCSEHGSDVLDVGPDVVDADHERRTLNDAIVRDTFATFAETTSLLHFLFKMDVVFAEHPHTFPDIFADYASCDVQERPSVAEWIDRVVSETEDMNEVSQSAVGIYQATNTFPGEYSHYLRENNYIDSERVEEVWSYSRTRLELDYLKRRQKETLRTMLESTLSPHTHDYRLIDSFYLSHMHYYMKERHARFNFCSMAFIFSKDVLLYRKRLLDSGSPVVLNLLGYYGVFFAGSFYRCATLIEALYGWLFLVVYACNKEFSTESDNFILKKATL